MSVHFARIATHPSSRQIVADSLARSRALPRNHGVYPRVSSIRATRETIQDRRAAARRIDVQATPEAQARAKLVRLYQKCEIDADPEIARAMRIAAGDDSRRLPIRVVWGIDAPAIKGHGYGFRWRGKWKTAPGSYIPSTRRIEVGLGWLICWLYGGAHR